MLQVFDKYATIFHSWRVLQYEQEDEIYLLQIEAVLRDGSLLELRDYLFSDGRRKYAYHWMDPDNRLRRRWDNAPHWPNISTAPHHVHLPEQSLPSSSTITNLEELFAFIAHWLENQEGSSPP